MEAVVLVIHLMLALALIAIILIQKSEGGGLGIGGGGGGMGGLATARGTANMLTRLTTILAVCFFTTSITLALIAKNANDSRGQSILDLADDAAVTVPLARDEVGAPDEEVLMDPENEIESPLRDDDTAAEPPSVPISE